jgi:hypothetical protein
MHFSQILVTLAAVATSVSALPVQDTSAVADKLEFKTYKCYKVGPKLSERPEEVAGIIHRWCSANTKEFKPNQFDQLCPSLKTDDGSDAKMIVSVKRVKDTFGVVTREDCMAGLMAMVANCDYGGITLKNGFEFRVDSANNCDDMYATENPYSPGSNN